MTLRKTTPLREQHRLSGSPMYVVWCGMKQRCSNPNGVGRKIYYERGIRVHPRWARSFIAFLTDVHREAGTRPTPKHQLDRIKNDRGYEPGNVRWATTRENSRNARHARFIEFNGERLCLTDWAMRIGIEPSALASRLRKLPLSEALTRPPRIPGQKRRRRS